MGKGVRIYTTDIKTHLLRVPEAIEEAMKELDIATEKWCYPVSRFGMPNDHYYAEIWFNGMDWQNTYWIVETANFSDPIVHPLMMFQDHSIQDKFNVFDFKQLLQAICYFRRNKLWLKPPDPHYYGPYGDSVWPYLSLVDTQDRWRPPEGMPEMRAVEFRHASQPAVMFLVNKDFVPERICGE